MELKDGSKVTGFWKSSEFIGNEDLSDPDIPSIADINRDISPFSEFQDHEERISTDLFTSDRRPSQYDLAEANQISSLVDPPAENQISSLSYPANVPRKTDKLEASLDNISNII